MGIFENFGIKIKRDSSPELPSPEWEGAGMQSASMNNPYDTASAKEMIDFVEKEFEKRQKERVPFELQWRLNIAFMEINMFKLTRSHRL